MKSSLTLHVSVVRRGGCLGRNRSARKLNGRPDERSRTIGEAAKAAGPKLRCKVENEARRAMSVRPQPPSLACPPGLGPMRRLQHSDLSRPVSSSSGSREWSFRCPPRCQPTRVVLVVQHEPGFQPARCRPSCLLLSSSLPACPPSASCR